MEWVLFNTGGLVLAFALHFFTRKQEPTR